MLIASLLFGLIPEGVYASNKSKELQQEEEKDTWLVNSNLMQNKYLGLYTSNDGQFSIGTTGGNPENEKDDNQKMLYGYNYRSTSYTTFRINGSNKHFPFKRKNYCKTYHNEWKSNLY